MDESFRKWKVIGARPCGCDIILVNDGELWQIRPCKKHRGFSRRKIHSSIRRFRSIREASERIVNCRIAIRRARNAMYPNQGG